MTTEEFTALVFTCLRARGHVDARERLKTLSIEEWRSLIAVADDLMVGPMMRRQLLSSAFEPHSPAQLRPTIAAEQRRTTMATMRLHADFRSVILAFERGGIPAIALKGLHLATEVYRDLAARTTGDIDLLVRATDLARAGELLQEVGYKPVRPYRVRDDEIPYSWHELPRFVKSGATDVEIHWHVADDPTWTGMPVWFDINELWDRAAQTRVAGVNVRVLSPEHLLLHVCIHATCSHLCEFSARPWCDIAETIARYHDYLSWKQVDDCATRWHCRRGVYLALRLSRDLVGAAVPDETLRALRPVDFDEQILAVAMRQRHRARVVVSIAQFDSRNPVAKLRVLLKRLLIPPSLLADTYNVPRSSRFLYAFYLIRAKDLVRHHWRTVFRVHRGDSTLTTLARDTVALQEFLAGG